jgi:hypothetical protein
MLNSSTVKIGGKEFVTTGWCDYEAYKRRFSKTNKFEHKKFVSSDEIIESLTSEMKKELSEMSKKFGEFIEKSEEKMLNDLTSQVYVVTGLNAETVYNLVLEGSIDDVRYIYEVANYMNNDPKLYEEINLPPRQIINVNDNIHDAEEIFSKNAEELYTLYCKTMEAFDAVMNK